MELGWGGFDRAKLDMLILIRIPFSVHVSLEPIRLQARPDVYQIMSTCTVRFPCCSLLIHSTSTFPL